jgi:hypothetical protein
MLVEIDTTSGPMLFEAKKAYADTTFFAGKDKGTMVLDSASYMFNEDRYKVELSYDQFRWAYARSVKNQEPFVDLKQDNLPKIKQDYARQGSGPKPDAFPHRPS